MSKLCSCGARIEFVKVGAKKVPVDPSAPVYAVTYSQEGGDLLGKRINDEPGKLSYFAPVYWVSHFNTCPDAGAYSLAKNKRVEQLVELIAAVDELVVAKPFGRTDSPALRTALGRLVAAREAIK